MNERVNKRPASYHRGTAFYYLNGFQRATSSRKRNDALRVGRSKETPERHDRSRVAFLLFLPSF